MQASSISILLKIHSNLPDNPLVVQPYFLYRVYKEGHVKNINMSQGICARYDFYLKRILLHTATDVSSRSHTNNTQRKYLCNTCRHTQIRTHTHTHTQSLADTLCKHRGRGRERTDCKIFVIILLSSCQAEIMSLFSD